MDKITNNSVYCGGYNEQYGFKRNKRDIVKTLLHEGRTYELKEAFGYNRALIYKDIDEPTHELLVSYNTIVAEKIDGVIDLYGWYSRTTAKHINTYLEQYGLRGLCKKELENTTGVFIPNNYILEHAQDFNELVKNMEWEY